MELPFLQQLAPATAVVPLVLGWDDWGRCETLAVALAKVVAGWPTEVLLLASSDLTHYESAAAAARKDRMALAALERLDGRGLLETCRSERISMCGIYPATAALSALGRLGARAGTLVGYATSGEVTGDFSDVVAYAGMHFH